MRRRRPSAVAVVSVGAFISFGLPSGALGVAWPSMRETFDQPLAALGLVFTTFTIGYLVAAVTHGRVAPRVPTALFLLMSAGFNAVGLGAIAFAPVWTIVLVGSVLQGIGSAGLDAELNAYVSVHHSHRLLNVMHGGFGIGATAGPVLVTLLLRSDLFSSESSWRVAYAVIASASVLVVAGLALTRRSWQGSLAVVPTALDGPLGEPESLDDIGSAGPVATVPVVPDPAPTRRLRLAVVFSLLTFFVYAGVEFGAGSWAFTYLVGGGTAATVAGLAATGYWGALTVGRLGLGALGTRALPTRVLVVSVSLMVAATIPMLFGGAAAVFGLMVLGLGAAGVFPSLVALTPVRLGQVRARRLMGLQLGAAVAGSAVISSLMGVVAEHRGEASIGPSLLVTAAALALTYAVLAWLVRGPAPVSGVPSTVALSMAPLSIGMARPSLRISRRETQGGINR